MRTDIGEKARLGKIGRGRARLGSAMWFRASRRELKDDEDELVDH